MEQVEQALQVGGRISERCELAISFVLKLAHALQEYGSPSHRLEEFMTMLNARLGIEGQFFSSPSSLMASFGTDRQRRTFILRASSGTLNLEKQDLLFDLADKVASDEITLESAVTRLEEIVSAPDRYGPILTMSCFVLTSAGAAQLFGGGWREILIATIISLGLGSLFQLSERFPSLSRVIPPLAAVGAIVLGKAAVLFLGSYAVQIAIVTGLIVLIPGLSLTVAMTELATGHPVSGTARLANTLVLFMMIGFGLALGGQIDQLFPNPVVYGEPIPLPRAFYWLSLLVVPLTFAVLFKAKPRDAGWVFLAGVFSFVLARTGSQVLGPELGSFLAAFLLGLGSNGFGRLFNRPTAITLIPGIMLLVPGSVGFRSLSSFLARDTITGMETAFSMTLIAVSLAAGLLFANVFLSPKRTP